MVVLYETPAGAAASMGNGFPDYLKIKTTLSFSLPLVIEALSGKTVNQRKKV